MYDLEFVEGKINVVKFYRYSYSIPDPFFNEKDGCIKSQNNSEIYLDSLEVFQIIKC